MSLKLISGKFNRMKFFAKTAFATTALLGLLSAPAIAQQGNVSSSGWFKTCNEADGNKVCVVEYRVVASDGNQLITTISLVEVTGAVERKIFRVIVPTGRSLPPGIQIQVDGKRSVVIPYLFCRPNICAAEAALNDQLVKVFKAGGRLDVTSLNFQSKPNAVPITLKGFTAAYDGPPIKQEDPASREELLKKQLEEKLKQQQGTAN